MTAETVICPGCDLPQAELRKSPWINEAVCSHCWRAWYDGATRDADLIRQRSRERQGVVT